MLSVSFKSSMCYPYIIPEFCHIQKVCAMFANTKLNFARFHEWKQNTFAKCRQLSIIFPTNFAGFPEMESEKSAESPSKTENAGKICSEKYTN